MKLERQLAMALPLLPADQPITQEVLQDYLSCPERVLQDLLQSRKLKPKPPDHFQYTPRPIQLAGFHLEPRVRLQVAWQAPCLQIHLLHYRLPGLERLERQIHYTFAAEMVANDNRFDLSAQVGLDLNNGSLGTLMPERVWRFLGGRLLDLILERLQQRCRRNLPVAFEHWLTRNNADQGLKICG